MALVFIDCRSTKNVDGLSVIVRIEASGSSSWSAANVKFEKLGSFNEEIDFVHVANIIGHWLFHPEVRSSYFGEGGPACSRRLAASARSTTRRKNKMFTDPITCPFHESRGDGADIRVNRARRGIARYPEAAEKVVGTRAREAGLDAPAW